MNKSKKRISSILIILLVTSLSMSAFAENWYYAKNVPMVQQAKSQWCWAASAEMAAKNIYPNTNRNQWGAVEEVKGSNTINQPGTSHEASLAAEYICYGYSDFKYNGVWSMQSIRNEIMNNNKPLMILAGYYNNGNRNGGHFVVIDAVYETSNYIRYKDPWDSTTHWTTYTAFSNGSYNSRVYEETVYNR